MLGPYECPGFWSSIPDWPNFTQRFKQFVVASTSTQVAVLPWRYVPDIGTTNLLHALA